MKSKILATVLIGLSLSTVSCSRAVSRQISSVAGDVAAQAQSDIATSSTTLRSKDGSIQLTVPATWQEITIENSQPNLVLQVKSQSNELQVGVQVFSKSEYPQITPELASMAASDSAKAITGTSAAIQQTALTQINQLPVVQYEARGEFAGHQVVALATMIESPEAYYNLLSVGYTADVDSRRDELNQVIQSFREVQAPTAAQAVVPTIQ